jgi:hypothetical protein
MQSKHGSLSRNSTKPNSKSGTLTKTFFNEDQRYDLYAVCYHQGDTLETGHYTAACKNPYDQQWYKFDDQRVQLIKPDEVPDKIINNEAYMLFYQRRKGNENSDSSGASTSSSEHWVSKIVTAPSTSSSSSSSSTSSTVPTSSTVNATSSANAKNIVADEKCENVPQKIPPTPIDPNINNSNSIHANDESSTAKELDTILHIDDIKPIDSDDIPEIISNDTSTSNNANLNIVNNIIKNINNDNDNNNNGSKSEEHSIKTDSFAIVENHVNDTSEQTSACRNDTLVNNSGDDDGAREKNLLNNECNVDEIEQTTDEKKKEEEGGEGEDEEKVEIIEQKIEVKVEISASSPQPHEKDIYDEIMDKDIIRNERDKIEDLMSQHKISNLLWNDQNNNSTSNRHSDIGSITFSDLLLMDRIDDISSTSLPKNYMLNDTERIGITNRIRGVNSCSKDTLLYIDQQSLLDEENLLENRSHWVSAGLLNV